MDANRLGPRPETLEDVAERDATVTRIIEEFKRRENMTVRAKFQVQEITSNFWNKDSKTIVLRPQYDQAIPEDQRFAQATPSGEFKMQVDNPAAVAQLELGKFFYIDLTPVE